MLVQMETLKNHRGQHAILVLETTLRDNMIIVYTCILLSLG